MRQRHYLKMGYEAKVRQHEDEPWVLGALTLFTPNCPYWPACEEDPPGPACYVFATRPVEEGYGQPGGPCPHLEELTVVGLEPPGPSGLAGVALQQVGFSSQSPGQFRCYCKAPDDEFGK